MSAVTITNKQGRPLEGVVIMVTDAPVSVPDMASVTDAEGVGSLGHLSTPGQYKLRLHYNGQQIDRQIRFEPGKSLTLVL